MGVQEGEEWSWGKGFGEQEAELGAGESADAGGP